MAGDIRSLNTWLAAAYVVNNYDKKLHPACLARFIGINRKAAGYLMNAISEHKGRAFCINKDDLIAQVPPEKSAILGGQTGLEFMLRGKEATFQIEEAFPLPEGAAIWDIPYKAQVSDYSTTEKALFRQMIGGCPKEFDCMLTGVCFGTIFAFQVTGRTEAAWTMLVTLIVKAVLSIALSLRADRKSKGLPYEI